MTLKEIESEVEDIELEDLHLRKKILTRRQELEQKKPFTKRRTNKLLALCKNLYGEAKIR